MSFYLSTLLLMVLFLASLMAVWAQREPWYLYKTVPIAEVAMLKTTLESSDKTRVMNHVHGFDRTSTYYPKVCDAASGAMLFQFNESINSRNFYATGFVSDDEILHFSNYDPLDGNAKVLVFRRRFPEWWWGHFHRPEVWACIALFLSLLLHFRKQRGTS